jgi:hypothetical protein
MVGESVVGRVWRLGVGSTWLLGGWGWGLKKG